MSLYPAPRRSCWNPCKSCMRCEDRKKYAKCASCTGRVDRLREREPDPDDYCRCKEGILQIVTKKGMMVQRKFLSDPYKGKVTTDAESEDEADWNQYVAEKREQLDDPSFNPIQITDV